jgi:tRNA G26 N,N-dimethylase Trm1
MEHWRIDLAAAVRDWLAYKKEKRQGYKEVGLRTLLSQIRQAADKYGEDAVIEIIHNSMASGYQGITLDRLQEKKRSPAYASSGKQKAMSADDWEEALAKI